MGGRLIALSVMLLAWVPASAEIRKWVDEDGQVHYEDSPKAGSSARQSAIPESEEQALSEEQERLQKQKRLLEVMESERRAKQQEKEKTDQERKEAAAKCENSQQELTRRQDARYLYRKGADGERQVLSEEERAAVTAEVEAAIKKWCK